MTKVTNSDPLRQYSTKELLSLVHPLKRKMGISRLTSVSAFLDIPGIHIFNAVRTSLKAGQISTTQGAGRSVKAAAASALMEGFERHCASHSVQLITHAAPSPAQSRTLIAMGYRPDCTIQDWVSATCLLTDEVIEIPAIEVLYPYHGGDLAVSNVKPHTSGLAAGGSCLEASIFGFLECIEREATAHFYKQCLHDVCGSYVDLKTIQSPETSSLYQTLLDVGYQAFAIKINCDFPTFYVAVYDPVHMGPKYMVVASSSSFCEHKALDRAFLEAIQGLTVSLQASREDLDRHHKLYTEQQPFATPSFDLYRDYFAAAYPLYRLPCSTTDNLTKQSALSTIETSLKQRQVHHLYSVDLSGNESALKTVKVIVPGIFDSYVNPNRVCS